MTGAVGGRAMMYPLAGVPPGSRRDVIDGPPYLGTDRTWAYLNETTPRYTHTLTNAVRPRALDVGANGLRYSRYSRSCTLHARVFGWAAFWTHFWLYEGRKLELRAAARPDLELRLSADPLPDRPASGQSLI